MRAGIARKALGVFQAYIEMMNDDVRTAFQHVSSSRPQADKTIQRGGAWQRSLQDPRRGDDGPAPTQPQ